MKTLLLTPELFRREGGIMRILRLYLKALCEDSEEADVVRMVSLNDRCIGTDELHSFAGNSLKEWFVCDGSKLRFVRASLAMGLRSDRVICGHIGQLPVAWLLSVLKPKLSYYLVAHGIEVWRPFTLIERLSLHRATGVLCVSEFTRQQVLVRSGLDHARVIVVHNALDPLLVPAATIHRAGAPVIMTVSRLSDAEGYKGVDHLILAMPEIMRRIPGCRLRVIGRGDGLPGLQRLSRDLGVDGSVDFAGYLSDEELSAEFDRCSLFALPSEKEGFGLVFLEAMAHGRPCLGARSGGVPEVLTADTGILVDYGDVPGIAAAAVRALQSEWSVQKLVDRAGYFSYAHFRSRLQSALRLPVGGREDELQ